MKGCCPKVQPKAQRERDNTSPPRELIKAIVDCVQPTADDTVCDPAAGTGGFLLAAYDYVAKHQGKTLDKDQKKHLRTKFVKG